MNKYKSHLFMVCCNIAEPPTSQSIFQHAKEYGKHHCYPHKNLALAPLVAYFYTCTSISLIYQPHCLVLKMCVHNLLIYFLLSYSAGSFSLLYASIGFFCITTESGNGLHDSRLEMQLAHRRVVRQPGSKNSKKG